MRSVASLVAVSAAVTIGLAGCGNEGGDDSSASQSSAVSATAKGAAPLSREELTKQTAQQIEAVNGAPPQQVACAGGLAAAAGARQDCAARINDVWQSVKVGVGDVIGGEIYLNVQIEDGAIAAPTW